MALGAGVAGSFHAFSAGVPAPGSESNREDLLDAVINLDKNKDAAVFMAAPKSVCNGLNHDWLTDALPATSTGGSVEGGDWASSTIAARVRLSNAVQTFASGFQVSKDQIEYSVKGQTPGVSNEYGHQVERFLLAIEQSVDARIVALGVGVSAVSASASDATAIFRAYRGWSASATVATAGAVTTAAVASAGSGVTRMNVSGAWNRSYFLALHEAMFNLGANPDTLAVDPGVKNDITADVLGDVTGVASASSFSTSFARQVHTDSSTTEFSQDIQFMRTPFGRVAVLVDRFIPTAATATNAVAGGAFFLYERSRLRIAFWRPMRHYSLPPTGDSVRGYVHTGITLEPLHTQTMGYGYNITT